MSEPSHATDLDAQTINYVVASAVGVLTLLTGFFAWLRRRWSSEANDKAAAKAALEQFRSEISELRSRQESGDTMRTDMNHQLESLRRQVDQLPTRDDFKDLRDIMTGTNSRIDRLFEKAH